MPARPWVLAVVATLSVAMPGCFGIVGCPQVGKWTEPGASAWFAAHPDIEGLIGGPPDPGFDGGPRVTKALPDGAVLGFATYRPRMERDVQREVHINRTGIDVLASSVPGGFSNHVDPVDPPSTERMLEFLGDALDDVYRGDAASRAALEDQLRQHWPPAVGGNVTVSVFLPTQGPWDFDAVFPRGSRFWEDSVGTFYASLDDWELMASGTSWWYVWDDGRVLDLAIDEADHVQVRGPGLTEGKARAALEDTFPGFAWQVDGFRKKSMCSFF